MKQTITWSNAQQGFTLVELLIIVAIIGILAVALAPQLLDARKVAADRTADALIHDLATGLEVYYSEHGSYPQENKLSLLGVQKPQGIDVGMRFIDGTEEQGAVMCTTHSSGSGKWFVYFPGYGTVVFEDGTKTPLEVLEVPSPYPDVDDEWDVAIALTCTLVEE